MLSKRNASIGFENWAIKKLRTLFDRLQLGCKGIRTKISPSIDDAGGVSRPQIAYIIPMNIRTALLAPLALIAAPAFAEMIPLADLSAYMNSVTTAETDFTQVNADGTVSLGKIYLRRPGRMRFEYAPPNASLVLTSAGTVAIFDAKSNEPPEQYPLSRTPLSLILDDNIDLNTARMVVGYTEVGNATQVIAQDPKHPEYGNIALLFTANPTTLRQWVITDDLGQQTTVILGGLTQGIDYPSTLFSIDFELANRDP